MVLGLLLYLTVIAATVIFTIGAFQLLQKGGRKNGAILCTLCGPLVIGALTVFMMGKQEDKLRLWGGTGFFISERLMEYHERTPGAFHDLGSGEEVSVAGFGKYLESIRGEHAFEMTNIRTKSDRVLDLWGNPVRFALDRNHDGYIEMAGRKFSTDHIDPPSLNYKIAVGIFLDPPRDWINIGKVINRR